MTVMILHALQFTVLTSLFWPLYVAVCTCIESLPNRRNWSTTSTEDSQLENTILKTTLKRNALFSIAFAIVIDAVRYLFFLNHIGDHQALKSELPWSTIFQLSLLSMLTEVLDIWISFGSVAIALVLKFGVCILVAEMYFYCVHRWIFHHRELYAILHKEHHEYILPRPFATLYCSVYEMLVLNQMTVILGPLLLEWCKWPLSFTSLMVWMTLVLVNIVIDHSGFASGSANKTYNGSSVSNYDGLLSTKSRIHDLHHLTSLYNFGVVGICDAVFKTRQMHSTKKQH